MKQLLGWFNWFNRERLSLLIGSGLLGLGAVSPWYRLPTEVLDTFGINFYWLNAARLFSIWLAVFGLAFTFLLSLKQAPRLLIWIALIAAFYGSFSFYQQSVQQLFCGNVSEYLSSWFVWWRCLPSLSGFSSN
ncbi:hypothetical protein [Microseira wollei]|uniref:hypothetical protein n=1 Tax=Microseira wollei TaxID=467598 RepID=UPI001CFCA9CB|nr:hypothetical protein [Microseira wollei]